MDEPRKESWLSRHAPDNLFGDQDHTGVQGLTFKPQMLLRAARQAGSWATSYVGILIATVGILFWLHQSPEAPVEAYNHPEDWSAINDYRNTVLLYYILPGVVSLLSILAAPFAHMDLAPGEQSENNRGMTVAILCAITIFFVTLPLAVQGMYFPNNYEYEMDQLSKVLHRYERGTKNLAKNNDKVTFGNLVALNALSEKRCQGLLRAEDSSYQCVGDPDRTFHFSGDWMTVRIQSGVEAIGIEVVDEEEYQLVTEKGEGYFYKVGHISENEYELLKQDLDNIGSDLIPLGQDQDGSGLTAAFALRVQPE